MEEVILVMNMFRYSLLSIAATWASILLSRLPDLISTHTLERSSLATMLYVKLVGARLWKYLFAEPAPVCWISRGDIYSICEYVTMAPGRLQQSKQRVTKGLFGYPTRRLFLMLIVTLLGLIPIANANATQNINYDLGNTPDNVVFQHQNNDWRGQSSDTLDNPLANFTDDSTLIKGGAFVKPKAKPKKRYTSYYRDATIFRDKNNNRIMDNEEVNVRSEADGSFVLPKGKKGRLYLQGGSHIVTGQKNYLRLTAPVRARAVSTLTTLWQALLDRKKSAAKIKTLLKLPAKTPIVNFVAVPIKQAPSAKKSVFLKRNAQYDTLAGFLHALSLGSARRFAALVQDGRGAASVEIAPSIADPSIYSLADALLSVGKKKVDLTREATVEKLLGASLRSLGVILADQELNAVAQAASAINQQIESLPVELDKQMIITANATTVLANQDFDTLKTRYAGDGLQQQVIGTIFVPIPTINPQRTASSTPTLSGTWSNLSGLTLSGITGQTLSISVNGNLYTSDDYVTASGTFWSLTIPASDALLPGSYEVIATVTDFTGNTSTDTTHDELFVQAPDTSLPAPVLEVDSVDRTYINLNVTNWEQYPTELFAARPDLPPCGLNADASRTWVDIYNSAGGRLYGFCALGAPSDLTGIWVSSGSVGVGEGIYITLTDRGVTPPQVLKSNVVIPIPDASLPAPGTSLPTPVLEIESVDRTYINLNVANWAQYPTELFAARPDLPPCGRNANASRTWVDIYNSAGDRLYGFCALGAPSDLNAIWVSSGLVGVGEGIYITLTDRGVTPPQVLRSNVVIPIPDTSLPAPVLEVQSVDPTYINLNVTNWAEYPTELFAARPDLPPCGLNANASRTWVDIYNSEGVRLYGFCALGVPSDLNAIWVSSGLVGAGEGIYITLTDRGVTPPQVLQSNMVIPKP